MLVWAIPLEHPDKRRRRELAHSAQRAILGSYLGTDPEELRFVRGQGGKPLLAGGALQFNLSHSGEFALLAVARKLPVGIDVQAQHAALARPALARRICTQREYARIGGAANPEALLRLWVRKEAVIKARGDTTFLDAGEIDVLDDLVAGGWVCRDLPQPAPGYRAAVAARYVEGLTFTLRGRPRLRADAG